MSFISQTFLKDVVGRSKRILKYRYIGLCVYARANVCVCAFVCESGFVCMHARIPTLLEM